MPVGDLTLIVETAGEPADGEDVADWSMQKAKIARMAARKE